MKDDRLALHALELGEGRGVGHRLAEGAAVDLRDLVRSDDQRARAARLDGLRLGHGQPQCRRARRLAGPRRLVHRGRFDLEVEPQALQQLASITRSRCEYDRWPVHGARSLAALYGWTGVMAAHPSRSCDVYELARNRQAIEGALQVSAVAAARRQPRDSRRHARLPDHGPDRRTRSTRGDAAPDR